MITKNIYIVYESIVREYDNCLLLKTELERRGFDVKIIYKTEYFRLWKNNAVCILPNGYSTNDIEFFRYTLNANGNELISLQYEQVISKKTIEAGIHMPKGAARDLWLFCWGNNCRRRLLDGGIESRKVKITGAMQLDFLRNEFKRFYLNREEMARKYKLDTRKKWILFISSFACANNNRPVDTEIMKQYGSENPMKYFEYISNISQKEILKWFKDFLKDNSEYYVIYRPHPVEAENIELKEIEKNYSNFKCISDLSVKQWILVSDINTTWFSTSIAEIYAARKKYLLLRPFAIKEEIDVPYLIDAKGINNYEVFCEKIKNESYEEESIDEALSDYYSIIDTPAYIRVADEVERIANNFKYNSIKGFRWNRIKFMFKRGFIFKLLFKKIYQMSYYSLGIRINNSKLRETYYINDWENSINHKKDPINKEKEIRLRKIVYGEE